MKLALLTAEELSALLEEAVQRGVESALSAAPKEERSLLSGAQLAARLGISRTSIHRMRVEGCPAVKLGDVYKYEPSDVMAWLRARGGK